MKKVVESRHQNKESLLWLRLNAGLKTRFYIHNIMSSYCIIIQEFRDDCCCMFDSCSVSLECCSGKTSKFRSTMSHCWSHFSPQSTLFPGTHLAVSKTFLLQNYFSPKQGTPIEASLASKSCDTNGLSEANSFREFGPHALQSKGFFIQYKLHQSCAWLHFLFALNTKLLILAEMGEDRITG